MAGALQPPAQSLSRPAAAQLDKIVRFCRTIGSILDAEELIHAICRELAGVFQAERVVMLLHDVQEKELFSAASASPMIRMDDTTSASGKVWRTGQPILVRDTFAMDQLLPEMACHGSYLPRSLIIYPLLTGQGESPGVIHLLHSQIDHFSCQDMQLLETIVTQVTIVISNAIQLTAQRRQFASFVGAVARALDARDHHTHVHSINVANYCQGIAYYLGLDAREQEWLRIAGLLHDVGKIATPQAILSKAGPLDAGEQEEMRRHAAFTGSILSQIEFIDEYKGMHHIVAAHHEKLDGSGYPWGLEADQICLRTRIISVADIFDALTQDRPYRRGLEMDQALVMLDAMTPRQIDCACVEALKRFIGRLPIIKCA